MLTRGRFANIRIRNDLAPGTEGGYTTDFTDGEVKTVYEAAQSYKAAGTPLVVLAGKDYGMGSSRDWAAKGYVRAGGQGGDRREPRAHPSIKPRDDGCAASHTPTGGER